MTGETRSDHGDTIPVYTTFATVWADIIGLAGSQIARAGLVENTSSHRVEVRFRSDLNERMRVKWGDAELNITAIVDPDRLGERQFLFCAQKK